MDTRTLLSAAAIADPIERARELTRLMTEDQGLGEAAARYRRQAIADARENGHTREQIAAALGVSPPRITQISRGVAEHAPEPPAGEAPRVLMTRDLPTPPAVRGAPSLFLAEAERQGLRAERKILDVRIEEASEHVAQALRLRPGADVVARRKLQTVDDVPVRMPTSYFRADRFAGTHIATDSDFVRPTLQVALDALGYRFGHAVETLIARPPTLHELEHLAMPADEWVVQVLRTSYSTEDTPVHALETICVASRHIFRVGQVAGEDEF